ncbi:hypothetical protein DEO72_LG2g1920 [Vigna unguiculata]|uniref:Uncharacterized protein n=1 Tax=Vigna unguiculata TaxID=3917 RepID=A0A4D6L0I0_VIGUN|nr:hypothetical protein DEO72_LG2g1920 [Vigna unguiculata]
MGMSKQDLAKRFKALRSSSQTSLAQAIPLTQEGVTVVSDEEVTQSGPSLKRRRPLDRPEVVVGEIAGISARSEHTLSSKGPPLQEGSSSVCYSFWDSQFNHRAHSRAHKAYVIALMAICTVF